MDSELSLPGLPCAPYRKQPSHDKRCVFSNVHTKLNIWVSLAFQRDVTMSECDVSGGVWKKEAKTKHCSVSCVTSEPELQEIRHRPPIGRSSRTAYAFFPRWITYPNKQTRKKSTKQFLKYSVSGGKKTLRSEAVQNQIVSTDSVTEFYLWEGFLKCLVEKLSISADFPWFPSFLRYSTHFPFSKDDQSLPIS